MGHTFGRLTLGMMVTFRGDGASFFDERSPSGWYWYLASLPVFQGSEPGTMVTFVSADALVGLDAVGKLA
jgi:hypothetical protein